MNEIEQLEHAIAALEAQRSLLGEAVVEAALAPMREKLLSLKQPAEEALHLAHQAGSPLNQAAAFVELGYARLRLNRPGQAIEAYLEGLGIYRQAGVNELASELLAGLALAHRAQGDWKQARAYVDEIWRSLERVQLEGEAFPGQALAGYEDPILVYLTCYEIFQADPNSQAQARQALEAGYRLLQHRADLLISQSGKAALGRAYLESLPSHRELLARIRGLQGQEGRNDGSS